MSPVGAGKRGRQHQSHRHHQPRKLGQFGLIMTIGLRPDALKPDIHGVTTHLIRGFMAFGCPVHVNREANGAGVP